MTNHTRNTEDDKSGVGSEYCPHKPREVTRTALFTSLVVSRQEWTSPQFRRMRCWCETPISFVVAPPPAMFKQLQTKEGETPYTSFVRRFQKRRRCSVFSIRLLLTFGTFLTLLVFPLCFFLYNARPIVRLKKRPI